MDAGADAAVEREQLLCQRLRADFEYNLQLVEERDAELARYEAAVSELRQAVNLLTAESSELKVKTVFCLFVCTLCLPLQVCLAEREAELDRERKEREEMVACLHAEMGERRQTEREVVDEERRRCEQTRRELEARLRKVEGEVERTRVEVTAHFEEEAHRTHQQHRTQVAAILGVFLW